MAQKSQKFKVNSRIISAAAEPHEVEVKLHPTNLLFSF